MRFALATGDLIQNVIVLEEPEAFDVSAGFRLVELGDQLAAPGWLLQDDVPVAPAEEQAVEPAPPSGVTMRQARLALLAAGKLSAVTAAIASLPSPQK